MKAGLENARKTRHPGRPSSDDKRRAVAEAIRLINNPILLAECALLDFVDVTEDALAHDGYFAVGFGLGDQVRKAVQNVVSRLKGSRELDMMGDLLESVVAGTTISAWAGANELTRSYVSRSYWKAVTILVTEELIPGSTRGISRAA